MTSTAVTDLSNGGEPPVATAPRGARLEVSDLHKSFEHGGNTLRILKGLSFRVEPGEMVAMVGASGAGKSTLLHVLGTLDRPTSGSVLYSGVNPASMSSSALSGFRNRTIGFVFQFHHLLAEFTAVENVMMPVLIRRDSREAAYKKAAAILGRVGLENRLTHRPSELSGGEQQRVALARAMVMEPPLLLADEPTGNLDTGTGGEIHELFFELNREHGSTMLMVTHNPNLADLMPRRLTIVDGGLVDDSA